MTQTRERIIPQIQGRWLSSGELLIFTSEPLPPEILELSGEIGRVEERSILVSSTEQLRQETVECLIIENIEALSILTELPEGITNQSAHSLLALVEIAKYLLELLCHGQVLPVMMEKETKLEVLWEVAFSNDHLKELFARKATFLPPILAVSHGTPEAFLRDFLNWGITTLCRTFVKNSPILEDAISSETDEVATTFLSALRGGVFPTPVWGNALGRLVQGFQIWGRKYRLTTDRPELSFVLKLEEPNRPDGSWKLEPGLGVKLLPGKYLLASAINSGELGIFGRYGFDREALDEELLREVGKNIEFLPALGKAADRQSLGAALLTAEETYDLLTIRADELVRAGVVLELPHWWNLNRPQLSLSLKLKPTALYGAHSPKQPVVGFNTLLDFEWSAAIDDEELTEDEFELLVQTKKPLVFVRGRWIEINDDKLKRTSQLLSSDKRRGQMRLVDALRRSANLEDEGMFPVKRIDAEDWLKPLLNGLTTGIPRQEQPGEFTGSLREYQLQGLNWLAFLSDAGIGGCLADDMGLGKTVQFLALLLLERQSGPVGPTLLVVPMSILGNWKRETERFSPTLKVMLHHGPTRLAGESFIRDATSSDLVLTTYALANRDEELFRKVNWHRLALDEAQSIKNLNTKQSQSVRKIVDEQITLIGRDRPIERLALTGTPLENHLEELFAIFDLLNPGYLGTLADFRRRFAVPIERYRDKDRAAALTRMIRPLMLRRLKSDPMVIEDLPEKIEMNEYVSLTTEQASLYQGIVDELLPQVEKASGIHRKGLILSVITRLKQICNDPALFLGESALREGRSGKTQRLKELLETILDEGDVTLIFSQYAKMGGLLQTYLSETFNQEVLFLHGQLTRGAREVAIKNFEDPSGPRIFILSLKAGGFGLNLTRANQVIHFDQWWNPAVENQATDRAHRIGQTRTVQVRRLISQGTLEERISALSQEKRDLASQIVGSTREYLTELNSSELKELLSLSAVSLTEDME